MNEFDLNQFDPAQLEQLIQMQLDSGTLDPMIWQIIGMFAGAGIVLLILGLITLVASCFMFHKMGNKWYEALVSGHNFYVMLERAGKPGRWIFFPLFMIIPIAGHIIALILGFVVWILVNIELTKRFGKGGAFALGMILLPFIFYPILGFGKATYNS